MNNLRWSDALIAGLAAAGLRHVVLSPGARSTPLTLAALRRRSLECHVINDERAAGYFALGIARAGGRPAALVCTSGTAAANYLPAVMEANLAAVPLLVLTADRPAEAVGWGANQTADQLRLYGSQVRAFHGLPPPAAEVDAGFLPALAARLLRECLAPVPGPVHANVPFREPLLPAEIPAPPALPGPIDLPEPALVPPAAAIDGLGARLSGRPGVIVCGEADYPPGFAAAVAMLAAALEAPVLAEPLSNLRFGPHDKSRVFCRQAHFLRSMSPAPQWVLRFGAFPVSRTLERWLAATGQAEHVLVAPAGRWPDPLRQGGSILHADPLLVARALAQRVTAAPRAWLEGWREAEEAAARRAGGLCAEAPLFEGTVVRSLMAALPAGAHCFIGNSLAIRAVDGFSGTGDKPLVLYGNRGASGIDGNLATAAGIAAASRAPTAVLLGDQAALHDCGSLALLAGRPVVLVVMDNGGGGIFEHLFFASQIPPDIFVRGWRAPQQADFAALAAAFGLGYRTADTGEALDEALRAAFPTGKPWLLRVAVDRTKSCAGL